MVSPSRTRRIAKWTGLGACVVLLALWAVSTRYWITYNNSIDSPYTFNIAKGFMNFTSGVLTGGDLGESGWSSVTARSVGYGFSGKRWPGPSFLPTVRRYRFNDIVITDVELPFWMPFTLAAIPTAILWRRDRRPKPGHCQRCGYDLRASKKTCPECGTAVAESR